MDGRFWLMLRPEGTPHIIVNEYLETWGIVAGVALKMP